MIRGITLNGQKEIKFYKKDRENSKQVQYINSIFKDDLRLQGQYSEFAYFGAFRCGKSFTQQLSLFLLCLNYSHTKAVYVRDTYDQLKDSVIKQFNDEFLYLDAYEYRVSDRIAKFRNGSEMRFRAFDYDTNILSSEYDAIGVCQAEDINYELFLQLIGRASGQVLGKKGILLVEGNPASGWVKERYKDQTQEMLNQKSIFFIEGQTRDNPWVTQEYIQSLIDNYPQFWLDRYLYGIWDNREELIFSEFDEKENIVDIIDPDKIPKSYVKRNSLDWGWVNPAAILYAFMDYDGSLTVYDEFYKNKTLPEDLRLIVNKYGRIATVADHSMKGLKLPVRDDENRTVWSVLAEGSDGVPLIACNKEELSNIVLTNSMFKKRKIKITKNCVNLIREIKNWKWKKLSLGSGKNMPEEVTDKDNHACDGLNYLVADLYGQEAPNPAMVEFKRSLQFAVQQKNEKAGAYSNS